VISDVERFMLRYVADVGELVLAQVGGHDLALFGGEIFAHCEAETLDHAAFDLSSMGERVDDGSDIMAGDDFAHLHLSGFRIDLDFRRLGKVAHGAEPLFDIDAAARSQESISRVRPGGEIGELDFRALGADGGTSLQTDRVRRTAQQPCRELNQLIAQCGGCLVDGLSTQVGDQTGDHPDIGGEYFRGAHSDFNIVG
jgi:hypothetical protein